MLRQRARANFDLTGLDDHELICLAQCFEDDGDYWIIALPESPTGDDRSPRAISAAQRIKAAFADKGVKALELLVNGSDAGVLVAHHLSDEAPTLIINIDGFSDQRALAYTYRL